MLQDNNPGDIKGKLDRNILGQVKLDKINLQNAPDLEKAKAFAKKTEAAYAGVSEVDENSNETQDLIDKEVYGPFYERAVELHKQSPDYYPDPDKSRIVQGRELKNKRKEYDSKTVKGELEKGHHVQELAMGGENERENIIHTGESTISRSKLTKEQQERYYNEGYTKKKNYKIAKIKEDPNGDIIVNGKNYSFGLNNLHTEATKFQNKVFRWQREVGLRK